MNRGQPAIAPSVPVLCTSAVKIEASNPHQRHPRAKAQIAWHLAVPVLAHGALADDQVQAICEVSDDSFHGEGNSPVARLADILEMFRLHISEQVPVDRIIGAILS